MPGAGQHGGATPEQAVDGLLRAALDAGGQDNVTAIVVVAPPQARWAGVSAWLAAPHVRASALGTALGPLTGLGALLWWLWRARGP